MFQTKSLRKIQILNHFNFSLFPSTLFSSLSLPCLRWTPRPTATGRALAVPPAAPSRSLLKLLIATRRNPRCARRGRPSARHGDEPAEPCRAPIPRSLAPSAVLSSLPFAPQTSPLPPPLLPSLLQAPNRAPRSVQSRHRLPLAPPPHRLPRSSLLRPSSRPSNPAASTPTLRWCSLTHSPTPKPAGTPPPQAQSTAGRPSPRSRRLGPPPREPRTPRGAAQSPLPFPQLFPHRRSLSSPENGRPTLLCSPMSARDPR